MLLPAGEKEQKEKKQKEQAKKQEKLAAKGGVSKKASKAVRVRKGVVIKVGSHRGGGLL